MNEHLQFEEDLELYALGALEGEERARTESHLAACPECAARLEDARRRLALLSLAAPASVPSPAVKQRLMRSLKPHPAGLPLGQSQRRRSPAVIGRWLTPVPAVAVVVLAILCAWLFVQNGHRRQQLLDLKSRELGLQTQIRRIQARNARARTVLEVLTSPSTVRVDLVSPGAHPPPQGKAFFNPGKGLLFYVAHLAPLSGHKTYQLWLVPAQGNPVSAGIFQTDSGGNGSVLLPNLPSGLAAKAFAVTVEPKGGSPQPTGAKVLIGLVSGARG